MTWNLLQLAHTLIHSLHFYTPFIYPAEYLLKQLGLGEREG